MSRSGYSDDYEGGEWALIRWRGAVTSAIRGKRGQAFLREMLAALDALESKRLISGELTDSMGEVCALGCVGQARRLNMEEMDPYDRPSVAQAFGISEALAGEIMFTNDDLYWIEMEHTAERRYARVRQWVIENIRETETEK